MAYRIGIVGVTGAVGQELLALLAKRAFPVKELRPLASARSAGRKVAYGGKDWTVQEAKPEAFEGLDAAIFSAGGSISLALAPEAVRRGCVVIDNSSAFRMREDVPLVVPEINEAALDAHRGIVANPNCSTAITLMALAPLHRAFGLRRFFASTYQAVSGTGAEAMKELEDPLRARARGETPAPQVYPPPPAFNLIPHVDSFLEDGYTKEEMKMLHEGRKILGHPTLRVSTTCVRVPVLRSHSIAVSAEFERPVDVLDYAGKEKCGVGRIRKDTLSDNGLSLWVSGDQLWKGAALNAVQIAEALAARGRLKVG